MLSCDSHYLNSNRKIRELIVVCRNEFLPLFNGNLLKLIKSISSLITPVGTTDSEIKGKLGSAFDWSTADSTLLGIIYESLIDSVSGDSSKKGFRRRSGIFYTPAYITEFLVSTALDNCLSVKEGEIPRIIDPACGCGAFLITALRDLKIRFPSLEPEKIAIEFIHGVDTDPGAVEVARMSLAIECGFPANKAVKFEKNVRQGDSLKEFHGANREFDIVVGNPPYRNVKRGIPDNIRDFCIENYRTAKGQWDLASPFVELSLEHLLKPGGACGLILPNPVLLAENYLPVRKIIRENTPIAFGPAGEPFDDPKVEASLLVARSGKSRGGSVEVIDGKGGKISRVRKAGRSLFKRLPFMIFSHLAEPDLLEPILDKIEKGGLVQLGSLVKLRRGLEIGKNDKRVKPVSRGGNLLTGESVSR
ncbi:MAG TPA: hypothetical protein ENN67_02955, partial [Firmicutes bacterium]|nr:hypothetical protein [Bacillota bacterium]